MNKRTARTCALTPLQQNMYASASLTNQPWQYVEQIVITLSSQALSSEAMGQAWTELSNAHPALRNVIVADTSGPPQQGNAPKCLITPVDHDWRASDKQQVKDALATYLAEDRMKGIDATNAPAFRIAIFRTSETQSILVWTFPHSLLDGRSFAPLLDEVFQRYTRLRSGIAAPETKTENAFETHCQALAEMSHEDGAIHFSKTLAGWEGTEGLVRQHVKPTRKTETSLILTNAATDAITALAKRANVTASTIVLAAWGVVLARFSGQADVVFGNTRNGRHLVKNSAAAAGCFITTVPVRLQLDRTLSLGTVLTRLRTEQLAVRPFEYTPPTRIRRQLGIAPDRQIFDSIVMFDEGTLDAQVKALGSEWQHRKVDLYEEGDMPVSVAAYMGSQLRLTVEYDPALVPDGAQLADHMHHFLIALGAAQPDTPLGSISMMDARATQQIHDLAGPEMTISPDAPTCIDRFEKTALASPDQIAITQSDGSTMTYGALDQAANQLAQNLAATAVEPGDIIGICMARGIDFITTLLAIWKAGAAFVPMDPSYPFDTLDIIASDSGARLVLTDGSAPKLTATTYGLADLNTSTAAVRNTKGRNAADLAYVIFTSGSTGRPKGVMVTHHSLAAHADAIIPRFKLDQHDKVLQFAALSFDVALEEIVPTLLSGATLVLRNDEMAKSVSAFLAQSVALGITVVNLPTGFWVALTEVLDRLDQVFPPQIRLVIVGGERVPMRVLKRWRSRLPDIRWLNGYGPTETTITCTSHDVTADDLKGESVPIGWPLAHARAWVLSKDGALAPHGVEGELFISGPAVAKGYINNPDQMAQNFAPALFDPDIGRIYATGDRVIWRGGVLHYLGRVDRQIKLRGFRIEPGQIEDALEMHDGIDRAYADLLKSAAGQPQLVAWYSAPAGVDPPTSDAVKAAMATMLPPQMQPLPIAVTEWPYTPGGKLDVARLPRPSPEPAEQTVSPDANNPLVQKISRLFSEILQVDDIGPATSFFNAGGDSLSLLRLMPELERIYDVRLEPNALYSDPTPQGVARALQEKDADPLVIIPIQPDGASAPLYAVHVLGDNGSFFRPLSNELGKEQPVFGLTVGLLTATTPTSVPDIANFYLHQINRHHPTGQLSLIAVSAGSYVTLELAQLLQKSGRNVQALILLDAEGPDGRARIGRVARVGVHLSEFLSQGWPYVTRHLATRRHDRAQQAAQARLQLSGAKLTQLQSQGIGAVEDFVAANMIAIDAYNPQPYTKRLTIFRAAGDKFDSKQAIETGLGWSSIAASGFDLTDVPGDHLSILNSPNVQTLGMHLKALLKSVDQNSDRP